MAGRPRALALSLHGCIETSRVELEAALAGDVGGKVVRETVGIVELENDFARDRRARQAGDARLEDPHTLVERLGKARFFLRQCRRERVGTFDELRIGIAHLGRERRDEAMEERALDAELVAMAQGAPDDAAQHVTAPFVRRHHAIEHEKRAGTNMVGDHAQRGRLRDFAIDLGPYRRDEIGEQVDVVVVVHPLQYRGDAFESHAGVDRRPRDRLEFAIAGTLVLHEHEIPDLDVTVAVGVGTAGRPAGNVGAVVVENLRARAARTGVAHHPEVVLLATAREARGVDADFVEPDGSRFVVVFVHGNPQPLGRQAESAGQEFPGKADGLALEVLAETEITEHLEKGVVPRGIADVVEVVVLAARAHAAL